MTNTTRAADVLLRALGGRTVTLRMPAPAIPADPTEQLGLATPAFQDIPLAPAVYRKARATIASSGIKSELLVSATAVQQIVGSLAYASASVLFANAAGILAGPESDDAGTDSPLLEIVSASAEEAFGQPYVYRLILRAPLAPIT
jgi:hypothetical protein